MDFELEDVMTRRTLSVQQGNDLASWRTELDGYYQKMQDFVTADPAEIFTDIAGMTARASYIRSQLVRTENRIYQNFRTKELDPFLSECDRQFKVWSRVFTVWQTENEQAGRL